MRSIDETRNDARSCDDWNGSAGFYMLKIEQKATQWTLEIVGQIRSSRGIRWQWRWKTSWLQAHTCDWKDQQWQGERKVKNNLEAQQRVEEIDIMIHE